MNERDFEKQPLTTEEVDHAADHAYECECELCVEFWKQLPDEEE